MPTETEANVSREIGAARTMEFRILGPLEVVQGGRLVPVGGGRQRALLALLLISVNEVVPVDRLLDCLWDGRPPAGARTTLRTYVSRLRRALSGGWGVSLTARPPGYVLALDDAELDAARFERLVAQGRQALSRGALAEAAIALREALKLWHGPALSEFAGATWSESEIARLEELRLKAIEDRGEADLGLGRHGELVGELKALVAQHPLRERLSQQLMIALYHSGRQAEALDAYQQLRGRLVEELAIEPGPELRGLYEEILRQEVAPPSSRTVYNLPVQLSTFIGREAEIAQVSHVVETSRLVTLTGAGGCGKTRLALAVGHALRDWQPDGVWFVDLAPLADSDLVPHAVATVLDVDEVPGRLLVDLVVDHLRPRRLLLLLDNCEHVVVAAAQLIDRLLRACEHLRVLATSREALGVPGEAVWQVPSLSTPDLREALSAEELGGYESVRLFLERAREARADRSLCKEDIPVIARVCARLDGIPLAIELASARTAAFSVEQIAARLDDCFRLLTSGSRTVLPRHQTLRATVEWSHGLLEEPERILFRRLAVFAGGFTLEAVETVCSGAGLDSGDVLDLLAQLVGKSVVLEGDRRARVRFRLLETIRQYARHKLHEAGEEARVRSRHLSWCLRLAEGAERQAFGAAGRAVLESLEAEHDNFRAALDWSLENDEVQAGLRLAHALNPLWLLHNHCHEGLTWMEALSQRPSPDDGLRSAIARRAANLAWRLRGVDEAVRLADLALDMARGTGAPRHIGAALKTVGALVGHRGELERARALFTETLATGRAVDDEVLVAGSLLWLGWVAQRQSRYREVEALVAEFKASSGEKGWYLRDRALYLLGWVRFEQGRYDSARERLEECHSLAAAVGDRGYELTAVEALGAVAAAERRFTEAREAYERAEALSHELPAVFRVGLPSAFGELAWAQGDHAAAKTLLEEGLQRARHLGSVYPLAWSYNRLGRAASARGDVGDARAAYEQALRIGWRVGMPWQLALSLEGLAGLDADGGEADRAARLLGAAEAVRVEIGAPVPPLTRPEHERTVTAVQAALGEAALTAQAEGRALALDAVVALVLGRTVDSPRS